MSKTRLIENRYDTIEEAIEKDGYKLCYKIARASYYKARGLGLIVELDDALQACLVHMWRKKHQYDLARGAHSTWIVWAARAGASGWLEFESRRLREKSLASEYCTIADLHSVYEEPEPKESAFGELDRYLHAAERRVLLLYYFDEKPLKALNPLVGKERNRQILARIRANVKQRIEKAMAHG